MVDISKEIMNFVVEHSGRFVSYGFDTIVASITTDVVAADLMTTASISLLEFPGPVESALSASLFVSLTVCLSVL